MLDKGYSGGQLATVKGLKGRKHYTFKDASVLVKMFAIFVTIIVAALLLPFIVLFMVVNFYDKPMTLFHLIINKENWTPFYIRDSSVTNNGE